MRIFSLYGRSLRGSAQSFGIALSTLACAGAPETAARSPVRTANTASAGAEAAPRPSAGAGAGPRSGAPQIAAAPEAPTPDGFKRLAPLPQGRVASVFTLTGATGVVMEQLGDTPSSSNVGIPRAVWISGDRVETDPERFRGLGDMGWVKLDTRGRKYPLRSGEPEAGAFGLGTPSKSNDDRFGTRSITALVGDPKQRLLAVVTWAASPEQQTSALYEWRVETNSWTKLRDTSDQAVIGVNDVAVAPLEHGAVVVELETIYTVEMPRTWRLRAVGHAAALPKLAFATDTEHCHAHMGGIALVSSQIVAWGQSCATKYRSVLQWFTPPSRQSRQQDLQEALDPSDGTVTPVGNALVVRPTGDAGYRLSYAAGRWVRDDATPVVAFGPVREKFQQAGLGFADAYDTPDRGVLALAFCRPETPSDEDVPTCAYCAAGVIPSAGEPGPADGGAKSATDALPSTGAPAKPMPLPKERGNK